jgi:hypothetical protein
MNAIFENYSRDIMIVLLVAMVMATLLVLVPKLLRAHLSNQAQRHAERLQVLERGLPLPRDDSRARAAGRTAALVPMVTVISAGTVTCFLVAYRSEYLLSVTITVWSVAGLISLFAITGGAALLGRLAQLDTQEDEEDESEVTSESK